MKSSVHKCYFDHHLWKRRWCSGNINAFQAFALGSIPGRRIIFLQDAMNFLLSQNHYYLDIPLSNRSYIIISEMLLFSLLFAIMPQSVFNIHCITSVLFATRGTNIVERLSCCMRYYQGEVVCPTHYRHCNFSHISLE